MYLYETHLHTLPVSKCAKADVRTNLQFYKDLGYDGVFVTNHFIDGNIAVEDKKETPYRELVEFYFSDLEEAQSLADEIGIRAFCGLEIAYSGTHFLIYGLDKAWFLAHPEIMDMKKSDELAFLISEGALVIHAHPFREAKFIDHIRLYPRHVHGVESYNANRTEFENAMADQYAGNYRLIRFAGTDNHLADKQGKLGGVAFKTPIRDERDFIERVLSREHTLFRIDRESGETVYFH